MQTPMDLAEQYILPGSLWLVMFTMGLGLALSDFRKIVVNRRAFVVGAGSMILLVPAFGSMLAVFFAPTPVLMMGLILLATTPSGILSNLLTDIAKGDVALSVSISLFVSLVYVFSLPFIAHYALAFTFGASKAISIPLESSISSIMMITVVPVSAGMLTRAKLPALADAAGPWIKSMATSILVIVFGMIVVKQFDVLRASFGRLLSIVVVANLFNFGLALCLSRVARLSRRETIAVSVEHLIRQEGTAIYVAVTLLHRDDMSIPMIVNTFIGMALCATFVSIMRWRGAAQEKRIQAGG